MAMDLEVPKCSRISLFYYFHSPEMDATMEISADRGTAMPNNPQEIADGADNIAAQMNKSMRPYDWRPATADEVQEYLDRKKEQEGDNDD